MEEQVIGGEKKDEIIFSPSSSSKPVKAVGNIAKVPFLSQ